LFFDFGVILNGGHPQPPQNVEGFWLEVGSCPFYKGGRGARKKFLVDILNGHTFEGGGWVWT